MVGVTKEKNENMDGNNTRRNKKFTNYKILKKCLSNMEQAFNTFINKIIENINKKLEIIKVKRNLIKRNP